MKDRKMSRPNKRIVILGAGYGGIFLATNVARHLKEKTGEVILVDRNPYHQLLQEIHLVAAGFKNTNINTNSWNEHKIHSICRKTNKTRYKSSCFRID
jgi:NADH dehydrogenase FAD-containing subunit